MEIKSTHLIGAEQILKRCLALRQNQSVVIFIDETTINVGTVLAETADRLHIAETMIFVPISLQRKIPLESDLSPITQETTKEARAVLTCVNGSQDCLAFRDRILETQWSARTRIGHMPGATLDVLELANVDFDRLIAECRNLELAMARGHTLEFISMTATGIGHSLKADIGGWERLPVASDGTIDDGVWGNVPSGETYIAPIEGSSKGQVVINGSIPGLVIHPEQEVILEFEDGSLTKIQPADNLTAQWLNQTQIQKAIAGKDPNWPNLAEIGIGVNPAVRQLTGNMLFDEKCLGTAHIALGLNAFMGGNTKSSIHCDMVVKSPTILIDGKVILNEGSLEFSAAEWRENYEQISLEDSPARTAFGVSRSGIQADSYGKQLQRVLRSQPGRVSTCFVGDDNTARLAYVLYGNIPQDEIGISIESLAAKSRLDDESTRRVLHVMQDYSLVKFL